MPVFGYRFFAVWMLCWMLTPPCAGQAPGGGLTGRVTTYADTPVPDVTITLKEVRTHAEISATTGKSGEFSFKAVPPGFYDLDTHASGFRAYSRHSVEVGAVPTKLSFHLLETTPCTVAQCEAAAAAKPGDYSSQFELGQAYFMAGDLDKASAAFEKAVQLKPDALSARLGLARIAGRRGDAAAFFRYTEEAVKLPDSSEVRVLRASLLARMNKQEAASAELKAVLDENPNDADALLDRGLMQLTHKEYVEAEADFRRAYILDPSNVRGLVAAAEVKLSQDDAAGALQVIATEVERDPQRRELRKELGNMALRAHQPDRAIAEYQKVLEQSTEVKAEQAEMLLHLEQAYETKGDLGQALEYGKRASELAPQNLVISRMLASLYERNGKRTEAIAAYRAVLKAAPTDPASLNNLAFLLADTDGDLTEALNMIQLARREVPNSAEVMDTTGWIYLKKGLPDSAARIFEELVGRFPTSATFHYHYGAALEKKGDRAGALKQLNLALENKPSKEELAAIQLLIKKVS
jgi:tetratricopeptide (TPR) repeat protein